MEKDDETKIIFTDQALANVHAYVDTLKRIHQRLYAEGYIIKDGELVPVDHPSKQGIEIVIQW